MPWSEGDGLTPTNLNNKLPSGLAYNVKDAAYGAVGNGLTDDTAAIQATIDAATAGDTILFPRGTYRTGILSISKSIRLMGYGASLSGTGNAIFAVTAGVDFLVVEGFTATFESTTGDHGKEFLVNASTIASATISNFGENLTSFAEYATTNNITHCVVTRNRLGYCKVTLAGSGDDTHVSITDNHWQHSDGTHTAPAYLQLYGISHAVVLGNRWDVYPPAGDNEDIVKIWGTATAGDLAEDFVFAFNRIKNLHTDTTCAQVDVYYGGSRASIFSNTFTNVQMHAKSWGPAPNLGYEYKAMRIADNTFIREPLFSIANEPEGTLFEHFLFVLATRFTVSGNKFVDLATAGAAITAIYLGRSTGGSPPDFDSLGTIHCRAFSIVENTASFSHGNTAGTFIRYRNNDASDLEVNGTVIGNVLHSGRNFWEASEQLASKVALIGNVWRDPEATPGTIGLAAPSTLIANDFPASAAIAAVGTIVDHNSPRIILDGTDSSITAGSIGIYEEGGTLVASSRQNFTVLLDNDANGNNAFFVYSNQTLLTGTPLLEVNENGETTMALQRSLMSVGAALTPAYTFASEKSLGFYRSAASTIAGSYGTFDLTAMKLSLGTTGTSLSSANLGVNEIGLFVGGTSGATLAVRSGGTIYYFASSASTVG